MKLSTEGIVALITVSVLLFIVLVITSYNLYTSAQNRELYAKCISINQQIIDKGGRDYLYCRL